MAFCNYQIVNETWLPISNMENHCILETMRRLKNMSIGSSRTFNERGGIGSGQEVRFSGKSSGMKRKGLFASMGHVSMMCTKIGIKCR